MTDGTWRAVVWALREALVKARRDELPQRSAGLAFLSMIALVPLLAAFSYLGTRAFRGAQDHLVAFLWSVLPFSELAVRQQVDGFLAQAQSISGVGFLGFLVTSLFAFVAVERNVNRIWNVHRQRPLAVRLRSFTLVLFWGPLMLGAAYSGSFLLEQRPVLGPALPLVTSLVGLTMLYWLLPHTRVRLRAAAIGGVTATILLALLRQGFGLYIQAFERFSIVYGSFGLVLLFMVSIQLVWFIVLLGSEVSYCVQHPELLIRPRTAARRLDGSWLGLLALVTVVQRFRDGEPITPRATLCRTLGLDEESLDEVLDPLVRSGRLAASSDGRGWILACDPYRQTVASVLGTYDDDHRTPLRGLSEDVVDRLGDLRTDLEAGRDHRLASTTVASLVGAEEPAATPRSS